jgi:hypothetical protein
MKIICLANSRKHGNHCIAGIAAPGGAWLRPISTLPDGALPREAILVEGREPQLLEVLDVPLAGGAARDFGFQPENHLLGDGAWRSEGTVSPFVALSSCEHLEYLLHGPGDRVSYSWLKALPADERRSLQLAHVWDVSFRVSATAKGSPQVRALFTYAGTGGRRTRYNLVVTDPAVEARIREGDRYRRHCLLAVSLGMPYPPEAREPDCFKLVAGVVEI